MKTYRLLKNIRLGQFGDIGVEAGAIMRVKNVNCLPTPKEIFQQIDNRWQEEQNLLLNIPTQDLIKELKKRGLGVFPLELPFSYIPEKSKQPHVLDSL